MFVTGRVWWDEGLGADKNSWHVHGSLVACLADWAQFIHMASQTDAGGWGVMAELWALIVVCKWGDDVVQSLPSWALVLYKLWRDGLRDIHLLYVISINWFIWSQFWQFSEFWKKIIWPVSPIGKFGVWLQLLALIVDRKWGDNIVQSQVH